MSCNIQLYALPDDPNSNICSDSRSQYHHTLRDYATRQVNAFLWVALIAITALLLRKLTSLLKLWAKGRLIPGPPCPSFFGHSQLISRSSSLTDLLSKSHERYGPIVKLWLGPTQLLVSIKDLQIIEETLLQAQDKLPLTGRAFRLAFGRSSLFVSSFDKVEKKRNSLTVELNGKLLERANVVPTRVVDCVMERIQNTMAKGGLDSEMVSQHLSFTFLGATLFGDTFLAWPKAAIYEELLLRIAKDACFWASYSVTPFWKQGFWRYQQLCENLKCLTQEIIRECQQNYMLYCQTEQNPYLGTKNLVKEVTSRGLMLDNSWLWELEGHLDTAEGPCGNIVSVIFHGSLTIAAFIGNILARLVAHPELQDKIRSEIIMARKSSQQPDQQNVDRMPLLVATVYESARLLPAGPLLQRCSLKHDLKFKKGTIIPAGAILVVPIQVVQTDDSCWGSDAGLFNPYRFLSKAEKKPDFVHNTLFEEGPVDAELCSYVLNDPRENPAFLPFGSGARACVGQKLAILGIATLFATLLELYEMRLEPGSESNQKPVVNNSMFQPVPSPKIAFVKRTAVD